jgi:hypothetical protein
MIKPKTFLFTTTITHLFRRHDKKPVIADDIAEHPTTIPIKQKLHITLWCYPIRKRIHQGIFEKVQ